MPTPAQIRFPTEDVYIYLPKQGHRIYNHVANALQHAKTENVHTQLDRLPQLLATELPPCNFSGTPFVNAYREVIIHDSDTITIVNMYKDDNMGDYTLNDFISEYATPHETLNTTF